MMQSEKFICDNCVRQIKRIRKHYGEPYVDRLFSLLANEHANNWTISKQFELSMIQVRFLRDNFKMLYLEKIKMSIPRSACVPDITILRRLGDSCHINI